MLLATTEARPLNTFDGTSRAARRERLRFADFAFTRTPSGHGSATVTVEWDGHTYAGRADGPSTPLGDFRISADAALRALDSNLLIVCVGVHDGDEVARLVGCYMAESDSRRGAAMAVLNATNRVMGNHLAKR